jgi:hypothetical protein
MLQKIIYESEEIIMSLIDKFLQAIKKIPPNVKNTPLNRNKYLTEIAEEPQFLSHNIPDYKVMAYEMWRIIEDIEKVEILTTDELALRSILKELAVKRFVYLTNDDIQVLGAEVLEIVREHHEENFERIEE